MSDGLPEPLVPAGADCRDLDAFMLNVERLMASELVALSPPAVIGSALLLWCRAWKQLPAASLPNDDRVLAAFAKMPVAAFKRVRDDVLRGFVLCSDGRLYHRTLAQEAVRAYAKKQTHVARREADAERLRNWRESQRRNRSEAHGETDGETRFVPEGTGTGQGRDGTGRKDQDLNQGQGAPDGTPPARGAKSKPRTAIPDGFTPSDRVRAWAAGKGYDRVDEHAEAFVRKCRAKGYAYADHDAALMEAIREDWARLRTNDAVPQVRAKEIPILPPGVKPPPGYLRSGLGKPQ